MDVPKAMKMAEMTYNKLAEYYKTKFNKNPRVTWKSIAPGIEALFKQDGGYAKLKNDNFKKAVDAGQYETETLGRVERWSSFVRTYIKGATLSGANEDPDDFGYYLHSGNRPWNSGGGIEENPRKDSWYPYFMRAVELAPSVPNK
jgi:hypothetical protein